jgi:transcriptional regulator with XRE-family HTH domain
MPRKKRSTGLVQQLKDAIEESGLTLGELSRRSGVATSQLSHFVRGERTITLPIAEKLCEALGYELAKAKPPPARRKAKGNPDAD